jgi:hypothetical protein
MTATDKRLKSEQMSLARQLNLVVRDNVAGLRGLAQAIVPIPTTLNGWASKLVGTSSQFSSTISKSFDLVAGKLTLAFIPVIGSVIVGLQRLANWLDRNAEEMEHWGQGLADVFTGNWNGFQTPFGRVGGSDPGAGYGKGKASAGTSPEDEARYRAVLKREGEYKTARDRAAFNMAMGGSGKELQDWFSGKDKRAAGLSAGDLKSLDKMPEDIKEAMKQQGQAGAFYDLLDYQKEMAKANKSAAGKKPEGVKAKMDHPPGYQAGYQSIGGYREFLQTQNMAKSELDRANMEVHRMGWEKLSRWLDEHPVEQKGGLPAPPRVG